MLQVQLGRCQGHGEIRLRGRFAGQIEVVIASLGGALGLGRAGRGEVVQEGRLADLGATVQGLFGLAPVALGQGDGAGHQVLPGLAGFLRVGVSMQPSLQGPEVSDEACGAVAEERGEAQHHQRDVDAGFDQSALIGDGHKAMVPTEEPGDEHRAQDREDDQESQSHGAASGVSAASSAGSSVRAGEGGAAGGSPGAVTVPGAASRFI